MIGAIDLRYLQDKALKLTCKWQGCKDFTLSASYNKHLILRSAMRFIECSFVWAGP